MKRGKTETETLKLNKWQEGFILEGVSFGGKKEQIKITRIGEERFLCRWDFLEGKGWGQETGNTTLKDREWYVVKKPGWYYFERVYLCIMIPALLFWIYHLLSMRF